MESLLSQNILEYLDNIKFENNKKLFSIKSIKIKTNLVLQIEKIQKIQKLCFYATLIDNNYKSDKFILQFKEKGKIPKKGDIINIKEIEKCYNEENGIFIYKCKKINFIGKEVNINSNSNKMTNKINEEQINNINNIKILRNQENGKAENKMEEEVDEKEEEEEEKEDYDNNEKTKKEYINKNNINNYEEEKINNNYINYNENLNSTKYQNQKLDCLYGKTIKYDNCQNFLMVKNIDNNSKNFNIYLKCLKKGQINEFKSRKNKQYQNYIFSDSNNDKIEAVSFDDMSYKLNEILKINEIYQINNCYVFKNNEIYMKTNCRYKLIFTSRIEIFNISHMESIKNKFININAGIIDKNENNKGFLNISKIMNKNSYEIVNIFGFVLKDYGNYLFENKYNQEYYGRKLIIGDDSNYKIKLMIWHPEELKNKYNEGALLYIQNVQIKEYKNNKVLYGTKDKKILNGFNSEFNEKLKKYYLEHKNINEYLDIKIDNNSVSDVNKNIEKKKFPDITYQNFAFIKDILTIFNNRDDINDKSNKEIRFKISAKVLKINHSHKNYYYGCVNCKKKMLNDICTNCGGEKKDIIIHYSINVIDCTSTLWLILFWKLAENFIDMKGEEYKNILFLYQLKEYLLIFFTFYIMEK